MRRKYVTFGYPKNWTERELSNAYALAGVSKHEFVAGKNHRLFLFSADLLHEADEVPWNKVPDWKQTLSGQALEFVLKQAGPGDVLVCCDGRSKKCRQTLETCCANMRHPSEIWVVFTPSPRLGRRVSFASDNKEVVLISTPVPRTQLQVKERSMGVGSGAGESSTHDASYTGVAPMAWGSLPMLSKEDKGKILGQPVQQPRPQLFDSALGQPLFWAERKPVQFFKTLYQDLSASAIVDVSPGSGTAARAAMELGLPYFGLARNSLHETWLNNVAERAALEQICQTGTPMFHQDLAHAIQEHFQYILDANKQAGKKGIGGGKRNKSRIQKNKKTPGGHRRRRRAGGGRRPERALVRCASHAALAPSQSCKGRDAAIAATHGRWATTGSLVEAEGAKPLFARAF